MPLRSGSAAQRQFGPRNSSRHGDPKSGHRALNIGIVIVSHRAAHGAASQGELTPLPETSNSWQDPRQFDALRRWSSPRISIVMDRRKKLISRPANVVVCACMCLCVFGGSRSKLPSLLSAACARPSNIVCATWNSSFKYKSIRSFRHPLSRTTRSSSTGSVIQFESNIYVVFARRGMPSSIRTLII